MRRPDKTEDPDAAAASTPSLGRSQPAPHPSPGSGGDQPLDRPPLALARQLNEAVAALLAVVASLTHPAGSGARPPYDAALHAAQAGQAEAASCEREATAAATRVTPEAFESPLGGACLLLTDDVVPLPPAAEPLVERASQAARQLVIITDLIFNGRGLGSTTDLCAYVGELENQADAMYRGAVSALFGLKEAERAEPAPGGSTRGASVWTPEHIRRFRVLNALESLTDRCEEIADELLLLEYTLA
jgi:hypothetical protein